MLIKCITNVQLLLLNAININAKINTTKKNKSCDTIRRSEQIKKNPKSMPAFGIVAQAV